MLLDNERYNSGLASLSKAIESGAIISNNELNKQVIFEQQFITHQALKALGVNKHTEPKNIPGIERPICNQKVIRPTKVFISLIGSPNSGRSTALNTRSLSEGDIGRVAYDAMKEINNDSIDFNLLTRIQILTANTWHTHKKDVSQFNWLLGLNNNDNVFLERDLVDIPFIRSNFLYGRIDASILKMAEDNFASHFDSHQTTPTVIINTLTNPQRSFDREKEIKAHNVIQLPFLEVLHEQNIRTHYELSQLAESPTAPFNYLAVDMSDPNLGTNVNHLLDSIDMMVASFT